jgi:hypothetical protein
MLANRYPTLDFDIGETAEAIRETVKSFTDAEIAPIAAEIDRELKSFGNALAGPGDRFGIIAVAHEINVNITVASVAKVGLLPRIGKLTFEVRVGDRSSPRTCL